ncbi:hypothetical protein ES703_27666 [subsurface metagenome]
MKRHFILIPILCVVLVGALDVLASTPGTIKWACPIYPIYMSYPAIGTDGTIYVGSRYYLCAVPPDVPVVRQVPLGSDLPWTPAIGLDGTIYVSSRDFLCAFNPDFSLKWRFWIHTNYYSAPAIGADGTIYVASESNLLAINPDGSLKWSFRADYLIWLSSPAIGLDGTIYVGAWDNNLYAINPNGTLKWTSPIGRPRSPAIGCDGTIYVGSSDGIYALSPNGTLKWTFSTGVDFGDPVIGSDGTIYVASGNLYAIYPDGSLKWTFTAEGNIYRDSPAIGADGTIYVGSGFNLLAVNPDGSLKWTCWLNGSLYGQSPAIGSDGTIYIGCGGILYAIYGESGGLADTPWPMFHRDLSRTGRAVPCATNQPPIAVCKDIEIPVDENCQASITAADVDNGSYDPDEGDTITLSIDNIGSLPLGGTLVSLTVTDESGEFDTCQAMVTVVDPTPPIPDVTPLPTLTGECSVTITSAPTATDNCAGIITGTTSDPHEYTEQGTHAVIWTYDDGNGNIAKQTQTVVVDDVTAPIPNVPALPTVTGECSAAITSTPTATDNCAGTVSGTTNDPLIYTEQGTFTVTWTYNDGNGNIAKQTQTVVVDDVTAPEISVSVSPNILLTPNHKMVLITPDIVVSDNCDPEPGFELISITMNEGDETDTFHPDYDSTLGDGHTINDIQVDVDGNIYLRAERSGKGVGRIYTITYTVTDVSGNSTTATATVTVPHDQK